MGRQEAVFLKGEGDAWFRRNKRKKRSDKVLPLLKRLKIRPKYVLEYGCSDGWRIEDIRLATRGPIVCNGIDPSQDAIVYGEKKYPYLILECGTTISDSGVTHDLIIYGFCLYLCDRDDLAATVYMGDAGLRDGGHLIIHDFDPEYPHKVPYHHVAGLYSYKMDYSKLWLSNPAYSLVHKEVIGDGTAVWVLKKDIAAGWPEETAP